MGTKENRRVKSRVFSEFFIRFHFVSFDQSSKPSEIISFLPSLLLTFFTFFTSLASLPFFWYPLPSLPASLCLTLSHQLVSVCSYYIILPTTGSIYGSRHLALPLRFSLTSQMTLMEYKHLVITPSVYLFPMRSKPHLHPHPHSMRTQPTIFTFSDCLPNPAHCLSKIHCHSG